MSESRCTPATAESRSVVPIDHATLREVVLDALHRIAPEVAPREIDPTLPLRDQVDLGSMDWLNLLAALEETVGVAIPEADGAKLATLDELLGYLRARLQAGRR